MSLPPVIVRKPDTPSRFEVVHHRQAAAHVARVAARPPRPARPGTAAATPAHACSARAWRKPGTSTSPASSICCTSSRRDRQVVGAVGVDVGGADHAHRADRDEDVAVAGRVAAVDHRVHQPVVHRDHDPLARDHARRPWQPAMSASSPAQTPPALIVKPASIRRLAAAAVVAGDRAGDPVAVAQDLGDPVVGQDLGAVRASPSGVAPQQLPGVDRGVRHLEGAGDAGVEPRLARAAPPRPGSPPPARPVVAAAGQEPVGVAGVVGGGGDEEAAGVLDGLGGDAADGRVLLGALRGGARVGPRSGRPSGAARGSGRSCPGRGPPARRRTDAEAAHGGVADDPEAGRAAADDEDVTFERACLMPSSSSLDPVERLGDRLLPVTVVLARAARRPSSATSACPRPSSRAGPPAPARTRSPGRPRRRRRGRSSRPPAGRMTGTPSMSAWNCMSRSLPTMPPSTFSDSSVDAGVGVHRLDDLAGLVRGRLERRAGDVARR